MATEIKLPELAENLSSGDVLDLKVAVGDSVRQGQTLLEVEAEKSTVEVPSPVAGRLLQMLVKKGDTVHVGQTLCLIDESGDGQAEGPKAASVRPGPGARTEPDPAHAAAAKGPGPRDAKENAAGVAAAMPSATPPQAKPPRDGERGKAAKPVAPPERDQARGQAKKLMPAGPATRRLARELGVDLTLVHGSAPGGRVTQEDVKAFVRDLATTVVPAGPGFKAPPLPDFERWGKVERRSLDAVRRKTAEQMALAWSLIPHVTQHDLADVTELEAFRKQREGSGPKLTITAFALKATAIALRQFPQFNASLDLANNQLIVKQYYHIGVAVDTDRGLLVPVLRDVDRKSVQELAAELTEIAGRAREKKVSLDEMRGGTFTITNLGGIGGTAFTPIINFPEVAILGLSRGRIQPVVRDGQVVPRLLLPLSLSYDHRVIDGADAARFTRRLAEMLENPLVMLLHA
jgi:pyruvate dehydrogenase E2 component (dihydrolipoamide acetyltransferase)